MWKSTQHAKAFGRLAVCYLVMGVLFLFKEGDWSLLALSCLALAGLSGKSQDQANQPQHPYPGGDDRCRS